MCFSNSFTRALLAALVASLVTACGGGSTAAPTPPSNNVLGVTVDLGPAGNAANTLYTTVTICRPGSSTQCQTIDHVLVDTGSTGLRLLSPLLAPGLNLSRQTGVGGLPLLACAQFVDNSFAWGPVVTADLVLGAKKAANVPIQIIADPTFNGLAAACASGTAITSAAILGANGILGLGLFNEDCGPACAALPGNGFYFTCTDATCKATTGSLVSTAKQLQNPVSMFASDNNGVLIDLPAVSAAGAASLNGSLIFGVGTQTNNQLTSGSVLTTDASGYITTVLAGRTLNTSFIDTGSNGLYFESSTIPNCSASSASGFYCPSAPLNLSATQLGANGASASISFSIHNAVTLFSDPSKAVLPTLSGPSGDATTFDWGLPFFYGRRVFVGIEGRASALGTGPYYAF